NISLDDTQPSANPAKQLDQIICEGPPLGFHVVCACDTANNANRFFSRRTLSEFELRVLFQMSANDSASLIDTPKAANLGLHRAILCNAQAGTLARSSSPLLFKESEWKQWLAKFDDAERWAPARQGFRFARQPQRTQRPLFPSETPTAAMLR